MIYVKRTVRNGNGTWQRTPLKTIEATLVSALFTKFCLLFGICSHCRINITIRTWIENITKGPLFACF